MSRAMLSLLCGLREVAVVFSPVSNSGFVDLVSGCRVVVPVEAHPVWDAYIAWQPGQKLVGHTRWVWLHRGEPRAVFSAITRRGKGMNYVWLRGGPVWLEAPTQELEQAFIHALSKWQQLRKYVFVRLSVTQTGLDQVVPCCDPIAYDRTVYVDLKDSFEETVAGLPKRGRRDVRKALRECDYEITWPQFPLSDERIGEYHALITDTGRKGGYNAGTVKHYKDFLNGLGGGGLRVVEGRDSDGKLHGWAAYTLSSTLATYYYASATTKGYKHLLPDALLAHIMQDAADHDATRLDLMGIGSDLAPHLNALNRFKTKYGPEAVCPWAVDLPLKPVTYRSHILADKLRTKARKLVRRTR